MSRQSISKWETGGAVPEMEKLMRLSALFGVTLDELVTRERPEGPERVEPPPPQDTPERRRGGAAPGIGGLVFPARRPQGYCFFSLPML